MHWNRVKASPAQYPTNHLTKHKCRAVVQPGHQVGKSYHHLLKVFNTFKPENVHILSPQKMFRNVLFQDKSKENLFSFQTPYLDIG